MKYFLNKTPDGIEVTGERVEDQGLFVELHEIVPAGMDFAGVPYAELQKHCPGVIEIAGEPA